MCRSGRGTGIRVWCGVVFAIGCLFACTSSDGVKRPAASALVEDIDIILVAPFEPFPGGGEERANRCPICNTVVDAGPVESGASEFLTRQLMAHMKAMSEYTLLGPGTASGVRARIISEDMGMSSRRLLVEMGKESGADAVLSGVIHRFRQRVGTALSVQTPASVGFGVHLIRCRDGALVWADHFVETQQDLSENLLKLRTFVERGGRWLTAEQLAARGLVDVMATFPERQ